MVQNAFLLSPFINYPFCFLFSLTIEVVDKMMFFLLQRGLFAILMQFKAIKK